MGLQPPGGFFSWQHAGIAESIRGPAPRQAAASLLLGFPFGCSSFGQSCSAEALARQAAETRTYHDAARA